LKTYTYVEKHGNNIYHRYVEDGKHFSEIVSDFEIPLYLRHPKGESLSLYKEPLIEKVFHAINEAKDFIDRYDGVDGMDVYGQTDFTQTFISKYYPQAMEFNINDFVIASVDLEVEHDDGFPEPEHAKEPIMSISMKVFRGESLAFGMLPKPDAPELENVNYFHCRDERDMLSRFLIEFRRIAPHIFTGWNVYGFDIPYLVNRLNNVFGENYANNLSPFYGKGVRNCVRACHNKEGQDSYKILGFTVLDYQELYKKFNPDKQESYKLDYIGEVEGVGRKIDYSEYGNSLMRLYRGDWHVSASADPQTLPEKDRWARMRGIICDRLKARGIDPKEA
jgi:DNA polymerase elongation subunit (family B)